jgi:hypothetical protein
MTESEWLAGPDETRMIVFSAWRSQRKLTLSRVAKARLIWHLLSEKARVAVEIQEAIAEGRLDHGALNPHLAAADEALRTMLDFAYREGGDDDALALAVRDSEHRLLYEVFGNPFRPVAFDPAWRTSDATALATGIYEDRAFDRMPILADALQDAGCTSDDLLNHLRDPHATHVRGCWALDLVLGKE